MKKRVQQHIYTWQGIVGAGIFLLLMGVLIGTFVLKKPFTFSCANSISCISDLSGQFESGKSLFMGHDVATPAYLSNTKEARTVLGDTGDEKHIYVDLSKQLLTAYQGKHLVMTFPVSTGKWGRTPVGDFRIWIKLRYTRMEGGNKEDGTYYNLYNVPYTMFFGNDQVDRGLGFSLHGAYWHNNFGHPMSHGCVNLRPEDAGQLFDWASPATTGPTTYPTEADPGTVVTIFGTPPEE